MGVNDEKAARFVYYSHTHDTLCFSKQDERTGPWRALFSTLAFLGSGVMYFGGGWGMAPRPDADEARVYSRSGESYAGADGKFLLGPFDTVVLEAK